MPNTHLSLVTPKVGGAQWVVVVVVMERLEDFADDAACPWMDQTASARNTADDVFVVGSAAWGRGSGAVGEAALMGRRCREKARGWLLGGDGGRKEKEHAPRETAGIRFASVSVSCARGSGAKGRKNQMRVDRAVEGNWASGVAGLRQRRKPVVVSRSSRTDDGGCATVTVGATPYTKDRQSNN